MKRNILVPTDFSGNAWNALNYAVHLFKDEACTFYLLNAFQVYDFPTEILLPQNPAEARFNTAREYSEKGLQRLVDEMEFRANPLHKFQPISFYERFLNTVRKTVEDKKIDLIIMGTRGENNTSGRIYGSSAVEVIENIRQCPVMAIPEKANVFVKGHKKEIVFSTNFKTPYRKEDLDFLMQTANLFKAEIRVLHIQENESLTPLQEKNKKLIEDHLKGSEYGFNTLTHIKVAPGIHSFIESRGSDMLAMVHKNHTFFNSIFNTSLVEQLNHQQRVPLLVI